MNERQYRELCNVFDNVLNQFNSTLDRVAFSCLHLVRGHPIFLKKYEEIFHKGKSLKIYLKEIIEKCKYNLWFSLTLLRSIFTTESTFLKNYKNKIKYDYLFISHILNSDFSADLDAYFAGAPKYLSLKGYRVLVLYINHSKKVKLKMTGKYSNNLHYCILPKSLDFFTELNIQKKVNNEIIKIKEFFEKEYLFNKKKKFLDFISKEAFSPYTHFNFRLNKILNNLTSKHKFDVVVTTYEGHAWERIAYFSTRQINKNIICVGYQHAPIFEFQHAIKRSLGEGFDPDLIASSGSNSKAILRKDINYQNCLIKNLGSKFFDREIKNLTSYDLMQSFELKPKNCFVLPEGDINEMKLLFNFSIDLAKELSDVNFIWRVHPLYKDYNLKNLDVRFCNLPDNIIISNAPLESDILISKWVLYRGTAALMPFIFSGSQPIYLKLKNELNVDPLYLVKSKFRSSDSVLQFKNTIFKHPLTINEWSELINFGKNLYSDLNYGLLDIKSDAMKKIRKYKQLNGKDKS